MPGDFKVKIGEVEGPLELILELIEKRKLHISSVSLSQIADEFIEYVKILEATEIADKKDHYGNIADFVLVASTLLLIKSKSLLPNLDLTQEETESIEDLEKRLALHQSYKDLSLKLGKIFGQFAYFARENKREFTIFSPTLNTNPLSIKNALLEVLKNLPQKEIELKKVVIKKIVSLEETIVSLTERVTKALRVSFKEFAGIGKAEKVDVIVSFLAMLELFKQGLVRVNQDNDFDDISIESENINTPIY